MNKAAVLADLARAVAKQSVSLNLSERLCRASVAITGATGVSLTIAYTAPHRVTLCSTDDVSARLEDLQDVLGQGPGPAAYRTGAQVRMDIGPGPERDERWPAFAGAAEDAFANLHIIAVPIHPNSEVLGVLTYYQSELAPRGLEDDEMQFLADAVGAALLEHPDALVADSGGPWSSRAQVHQAAGMVIAQLGVTADDAMALLRAHAFAHGTTLGQVAALVVQRQLDFSAPDNETDSDVNPGDPAPPTEEDPR
jgi:ANTAR domain